MNTTIRQDESHVLTRYRAADAARVPLSVVAEQGSWLRHKSKVRPLKNDGRGFYRLGEAFFVGQLL